MAPEAAAGVPWSPRRLPSTGPEQDEPVSGQVARARPWRWIPRQPVDAGVPVPTRIERLVAAIAAQATKGSAPSSRRPGLPNPRRSASAAWAEIAHGNLSRQSASFTAWPRSRDVVRGSDAGRDVFGRPYRELHRDIVSIDGSDTTLRETARGRERSHYVRSLHPHPLQSHHCRTDPLHDGMSAEAYPIIQRFAGGARRPRRGCQRRQCRAKLEPVDSHEVRPRFRRRADGTYRSPVRSARTSASKPATSLTHQGNPGAAGIFDNVLTATTHLTRVQDLAPTTRSCLPDQQAGTDTVTVAALNARAADRDYRHRLYSRLTARSHWWKSGGVHHYPGENDRHGALICGSYERRQRRRIVASSSAP